MASVLQARQSNRTSLQVNFANGQILTHDLPAAPPRGWSGPAQTVETSSILVPNVPVDPISCPSLTNATLALV